MEVFAVETELMQVILKKKKALSKHIIVC